MAPSGAERTNTENSDRHIRLRSSLTWEILGESEADITLPQVYYSITRYPSSIGPYLEMMINIHTLEPDTAL